MTRHNWTTVEIQTLLEKPLFELLYEAHAVHRAHQPENSIQLASLLSIKTGGCPEDCKYCPQSAHFKETGVEKEPLLSVDTVLKEAALAKANGASRFCMGASWRQPPEGTHKADAQFQSVLEMVKGVRQMGMEACVTLGMINENQAEQLKEAGLTAYNHNLDTSPEYYADIITTRTYQDRLNTIQNVRKAGVEVCCGGIIGMGESVIDRAAMLAVLANMTPQPESVPINALVPVSGTPLGNVQKIDALELVRMCAAARITMPKTRVRLSAGRLELSREAQILCFFAGANSIFYGEKLLTTGNNETQADLAMIAAIGAKVMEVA